MDLLSLPDALGSALNISSALAGLIISSGIMAGLGMTLAMLRLDPIGILIILLCALVMLVALQWMPYWVLILVCLLVAGNWAIKMGKGLTGTSSGGGG